MLLFLRFTSRVSKLIWFWNVIGGETTRIVATINFIVTQADARTAAYGWEILTNNLSSIKASPDRDSGKYNCDGRERLLPDNSLNRTRPKCKLFAGKNRRKIWPGSMVQWWYWQHISPYTTQSLSMLVSNFNYCWIYAIISVPRSS